MTVLVEMLGSVGAAMFLGLFLAWLFDELRAAHRAGRPEVEFHPLPGASGRVRAAEDSIGPTSPQLVTGCLHCGLRGHWSGLGPAGVYTPPSGHTVRRYLGDGEVIHNCPSQTLGQEWIDKNLRDQTPRCGHWVFDGDGEPLRTPVFGCVECWADDALLSKDY